MMRANFREIAHPTRSAIRVILQPQRQLLLRADRPMLRNAPIAGPLGSSKHR